MLKNKAAITCALAFAVTLEIVLCVLLILVLYNYIQLILDMSIGIFEVIQGGWQVDSAQ
jgi:hypothetical protein